MEQDKNQSEERPEEIPSEEVRVAEDLENKTVAPVEVAFRRPNPIIAMFLGWLVPGLGHYYIGEKSKGRVFFFVLTLGYVFGLLISSFEVVSLAHHEMAFIAQVGVGALTLPIAGFKAWVLSVDAAPEAVNPLMDPGLLYTEVAGVLNFLLAIDAFERALHRARKAVSA